MAEQVLNHKSEKKRGGGICLKEAGFCHLEGTAVTSSDQVLSNDNLVRVLREK